MSKSSNKLLKTLLFIGSTAGAIYLFNKHINDSSLQKNKLKIKEDSFFEWILGKIYYQKTGSGEPLLLIHDFSHCDSSYEWSKLVDSLSETHTVYTVDLLGCGRSDKPQITYTNFLYVQMITDFIRNIIGENTTIITSGFSSSLSIMSCTYDSSLIDKLIFINPTDISTNNSTCTKYAAAVKELLELPLIGAFIYNILTSRNNMDTHLTEKYVYNPFLINTDLIDTYYESAHRGNSNGRYVLSSYIANYMSANLTHGLKSINKEILIIGGEHAVDIETNISEYKKLNDKIISTIIPKTKKIPHFESPEKVLTEIKNFL